MIKNRLLKLCYKLIKIDPNLTLKNSFIIATMGGSKIIKIWRFSISGTRDPQFINFLKLSHFLQKRSRFRPPKSTPKVAILKMPFPTKTPVLFVQWGSENVIFWGGPGRTGFCKKGRHYYIAIFTFLDVFGPQIFINFDHADRNGFFYFLATQFIRQKMTLKYDQNLALKYR
jgi:hypothetical protein